MSTLQVDLDLVRKYNVPGPRYTSYPPATHFNGVPAEQLLEEIQQNNQGGRDLSLYLHLPFCQTLCWFCGCTTVISTQQSLSQVYLKYIQKELALVSKYVNPKRKVVQLHYGGGTPTFFLPSELKELGQSIRSHFSLSDDLEAGVEIDPRRVTREHVAALQESGFNRASIGIQDFDPAVQKAIHRIQPFAQTKLVVDWIRAAGFKSLNFDLIYGLPNQTADSFEKTLDAALALAPNRFSVFSYAHVPWVKPAQKILEEKNLPDAETKLRLLKLSIEKLTGSGYVYIGMDHFAHASDELAIAQAQKSMQRNFQGYSTRAHCDIYGLGMSSISQTPNAYWQNQKELPLYYKALDESKLPLAKGYLLTGEDRLRRETIMRLMCDLGLDFRSMSRALGIDFARHFSGELESLTDLKEDGLLAMNSDGVQVTELGRLFIRNIAMRFDHYPALDNNRKFSKTI